MESLLNGKRIGIVGDGQLGMYDARAVKALGGKAVVWGNSQMAPAWKSGAEIITGSYDDEVTFGLFIGSVDIITFEFESVPEKLLKRLEKCGKPVRPHPNVIRIAQDRTREKQFIKNVGAPTNRFVPITSRHAVQNFGSLYPWFSFPAILKIARGGYDGRGQVPVANRDELSKAWESVGRMDCILEEKVLFEVECSVQTMVDVWGNVKAYDPVQNLHQSGILRISSYPGMDMKPAVGLLAMRIAVHLARSLYEIYGHCGPLAVEFFVLSDGKVLVNELAPRPHNSYHGTIEPEACMTSQFENHIRAVGELPLGAVTMLCPWEMENLIGSEITKIKGKERTATVVPHDYGKTERAGRKMGHITRLRPYQ